MVKAKKLSPLLAAQIIGANLPRSPTVPSYTSTLRRPRLAPPSFNPEPLILPSAKAATAKGTPYKPPQRQTRAQAAKVLKELQEYQGY